MESHSAVIATADRVLLRPSKRRWSLLLLGCVVLLLGGVGLIASGAQLDSSPFGIGDPHVWIWVSVIFFALGIPISLAQMFSGRVYLELTPEGFTISRLTGHSDYRWSSVGDFSTENSTYRGVTIGKRVVFVGPSTVAEGHQRLTDFMSMIGGRLPDTYGMRAEDLAALMNRWRARYGARAKS
ncbi:MAG TPA: hypothetical protein VGX27_12110 [Candidatus Dormibacteraeota bacterium]|nr:hypothetical protein [Candidatus Dormibacteraeota bacterium]